MELWRCTVSAFLPVARCDFDGFLRILRQAYTKKSRERMETLRFTTILVWASMRFVLERVVGLQR